MKFILLALALLAGTAQGVYNFKAKLMGNEQ